MILKVSISKTSLGFLICLYFFSIQGYSQSREDALRLRSIAAFNRYAEVWNFNDFWKRGNTFDACLTFVDAALKRWPDDPEVSQMQARVRAMLMENLAFFNLTDPGNLWADDFGWWGLMGVNAYRYLKERKDTALADQYLKLATDLCWEYKRKTAYDMTSDALPVPHGCRNGDAHGQHKGVKNTVTNVLLFLLSTRIYRLNLESNPANQDKYLEMIYMQWKWFDSWFRLGKYQYLKELPNGGALVQERPTAFFEGSDYMIKEHPPWTEGWVWTGDQGMIVAALTDLYAIRLPFTQWVKRNHPEEGMEATSLEKRLNALLQEIGLGIKSALISPEDDIIREAPCNSSFGPTHGNDYLAGRGILMRYLGNPEIMQAIGQNMTPCFEATLEAIWQTRITSDNQFQPEFTRPENDKRYIEQFKNLWGSGDQIWIWEINTMDPKIRNGVCQALGLDALGALIRTSKT